MISENDIGIASFRDHVAFSEAGEKAKQQQGVAVCKESSKRDGLGESAEETLGYPRVPHKLWLFDAI